MFEAKMHYKTERKLWFLIFHIFHSMTSDRNILKIIKKIVNEKMFGSFIN